METPSNHNKINEDLQNLSIEEKPKNEVDFISKLQSEKSYLDLAILPIHKIKLSAPFPLALNYEEYIRKPLKFLEDYGINSNGMYCINKDIVNSQSGIFKEVALQLAKNILKGSGVISLSLPIRVFEDKSMLEKYTDWWVNAPSIVKPAGKSTDPLESFKQVIIFSLSNLHFSASQLKPFNPLLGETLQMKMYDGSKIYMEHTSHHPCVSNFYIKDVDGDYSISGYYDMQPEGTMKMLLTNYVYLLHKGRVSYYLKGTDRKIDVQIPKLHFEGIAYGERCNFWEFCMKFEDRKYGLKCIVQFRVKNKEIHEVYGQIFKYDYSKEKKNKEFYENDFPKKPFPTDPKLIISTLTGSYLGKLYFDNKLYYDIPNSKLNNCQHVKEKEDFILPSDPKHREDLNWLTKSFYCNKESKNNSHMVVLKSKFEAYAQEFKLVLESQQRWHRKLREQNKPKKKGYFF